MTRETDLGCIEEWWINVYEVHNNYRTGAVLKEITYHTDRWAACKDLCDMDRWGWKYLGTIENPDCSTGETRIVWLPDHPEFGEAELEYEQERYEHDRDLAMEVRR